MTDQDTLTFNVPDDKENMRLILRSVFDLLTEDPTYITNFGNARSMICKIDRDELMQALVREYLFDHN